MIIKIIGSLIIFSGFIFLSDAVYTGLYLHQGPGLIAALSAIAFFFFSFLLFIVAIWMD